MKYFATGFVLASILAVLVVGVSNARREKPNCLGACCQCVEELPAPKAEPTPAKCACPGDCPCIEPCICNAKGAK